MDKDMRRKIDMIKEELISRGHDIEEKELTKNGIKRTVFQINTNCNVKPVIYIESIITAADEENMLFKDIISRIERIIAENKVEEFDVKKVLTKENVLNNSVISIQKISDQNVLKKPGEFEGTEYVAEMRIDFYGDKASIKITNTVLEIINATEEEVWQQALENTINDTTLISMSDAFPGLIPPEMEETQMWILSNTSKTKGASAILNKEAVRELAEQIGVKKFAVIPSSIHECLLVPNPSEDMEIEKMIIETNAEVVDPEDQLADKPIFIEF